MKQLKFLLLPFIILACISSQTFAQSSGDNSNSNESTSFSLGLSTNDDLSGLYFQDPTGLQIAIEGLNYEGTIDKESYILNTSDLITVQLESTQNVLFRGSIINITGDVIIPTVGAVSVSGLSIKEAEKKIEEIAAKQYKSPKISISLEIPHPVNVHITGSISAPGKYVLPGQSRVDLALILATQPIEKSENVSWSAKMAEEFLENDTYSYRNITIEHKDGSTSKADLISYFRTGDLNGNPILKEGDRITLNRKTNKSATVTISGAVNFAQEIEYNQNDTPGKLLTMSNGLDIHADTTKLQIYRQEGTNIEVIEVAKEQWDTFSVKPNDRIIATYQNERNYPATAWILGEIKIPGKFPIINGETTVNDLIELSGGTTDKALPSSAYLQRGTGLDNEIPNKFNAELMLRTSDQLLEGLEYFEKETKLSQNRVNLDLNDPEQLQNLTLFNGDRLYIPRDEQTIFIFGQVNNPGYFPFTSSALLGVEDYITKAGGYALAADMDRVFILKAGNGAWYRPEDTTLESGDRIFVDKLPTDNLASMRNYEFQKSQLKNQRVQLWLAGISAVTSIITAYVAITR